MTKQMTRMTLSHKTRLVALLASTALVHSTVALAQSLPTGGQVAAGSASIGTPSAGALTVTQTSGSAVVNWQSFNVGKGNRVTFVQPDANAAILNRVTGQTSSTIAGQINANGQVYLINPNGIAITNSGTVKTGAFVASTLGISDDDFMAGKRTFTGNGASAPVTNAGTITINRGGYMALIGGTVANSGVITVPMGKAALGSGEQATLDLSGDGFLQVAVPTKAEGNQALVSNSGRISARGGTVQLTAAAAKDMARQAVNMSGTIEAKGVSGRSGDIVLSGSDGEVAVSGRIDAGNAKGTGGKVQVTGRKITLAGAKINASGKTGGGTVNIGGDRQGRGALQRAETLTVDANTVINADAITAGNGGNIVLWSDDLTRFAGTITAKGGALSGNGGEVEVSGKAKLSYTGLTDLTAAQGAFGNLLLDPYNVTISTGTGSNTDGGFNATGNDSIINVNTLTNALATANVMVTTGSSSDANNPQAGTITIAAPIAWNAPTTLTLAAASDININAAISAHNSGLIVSSGGTITATAAVDTGVFILASGSWVQNGAVLPAFSAQDFRITDGTSFLRVTGGDGTSATPYTVADVYGLQGIGSSSDYLSANWKLAGDIDASGTAIWNNGAGLKPIGDDNITFTGRLDGASHTITGLTINRPNTNTVGLFGTIGQGGGVSGLGLVNANVSGRSMTGGLAGSNAGGIVQSYISGSVSGVTHTGGLVGYNTGAINLSYSTASVSGASNVGGLLGMNFGTMNQVYASGAVSGMGNLGGLVGGNIGTVVASYFDMSTTLQSSGVGNGSTSGISGLNSAQARNASNYSGWDFTTDWYQSDDLRPIGRWEAAAPDANGVVTISNLHQLALMGANLAGSYKLAGNIDASATSGTNASDIWSTSGWLPVGNYSAAFTGGFDGAGHTINGLTVNRGASFLGLFGNSAGTIQNIGLISEFINGYSYTGALVGNNTGTISNAYATGTVNGIQFVGGLAGWNAGSVNNSYTATAVSGSYDVGGLVGHNHGSISNGYATGTTFGSSTYAGGLVGFNDNTIKFSYATGSVSGNTYVGGLVGYNDSGSSIDNAYASGAVNGSVAVGGLVGRNFFSTITNSFWDVSTTGRSSGYGQSFFGTFLATGLTTAQARSASNYSGWDFGGVWYQVGDMRPILRSEAAVNGVITNLHQLALIGANLSGVNTLANDIDASETSGANASGIWSTNGWVPLGDMNTMFTGNFNGNNHTISALTVGGNDYVGLFGVSGGLISNVGLVGGSVRGANSYAGALVGYNSGSISNSYSTATVSGGDYVGGLVGWNNDDTIDQAYASGAVSGHDHVGGLVGWNELGTISNAYASGAVNGSSQVGGLAGFNGNTISNSYASGAVNGTYHVGGLVGENGPAGVITNTYASGAVSGSGNVGGLVALNVYGGTISNSYAIGAVSGSQVVGGLVGEDLGGTISNAYATGLVSGSSDIGGLVGITGSSSNITNSFWDIDTTGQPSGYGHNFGTFSATGLTTVQMQDPFTFINAGWDFANVWGKSTSGANGGYMMLRSLSTGLYDDYVSIGNGTRTYGDANAMIIGATLSGVGTGNVSLAWDSAIAGATNAGTYNYSDPNIVLVTETGSRTAYVDYSGALTISQRAVSLTGDRTYDGSTGVAAADLSLGNLVNGDTLTLTGTGTVGDKNVGTGKALSLGSLLLGDGSGLASNYVLGTGTVDIAKATIASITGITADNKTYDGAADATLVTSGAGFTGMVAGDALTVATSTGAFSDKNAGTGKTVGIIGLSLGGTDAGNYTLASNTATTTADIAKASISSITGITADNKTYDGAAAATLVTSGAGFTGMVVGDALTVATSTGAFSDKNAGTGKTVGITGLTLGGTDAGNYTLASSTATTTADIARATISSITGIAANNKTYDGNTSATLNTSGAGFTGMVGGDVLTVATSTGAFSDKNAGTGRTVGITGLSLGGADAGNYTLVSSTATSTADIAKAYVFFTGISTNYKVYDGTTTATVNISTIPVVNTDDMHVAYTSANFSDKNAGISKSVAVDGLYITGADANNYQLGITSTTSFATITPAIISSIGGITANGKTYDGSTMATLNTSGAIFNGMIANDSLTVATALGVFSDQNAGTGKAVTISGLTLGGADALNYRLDTTTAAALADIGQRVINLSGNRTYNGSSDLDASIFALSNLVSGETLTLSGTGAMADKNAGNGKGVTLGSLALGDGTGLASNYTLIGGTDTADIGQRVINLSGSRTYDGSSNVAASIFQLSNLVTGETLSLSGIGTMNDKNVSTAKDVNLGTLALGNGTGGGLASNYTLSGGTYAADITRAVISSITGITANGKTYDGSTTATLNTSGAIFNGMIFGDSLSAGGGTGAFANANAGSGKTVGITGLSLDGADAGNYSLASNIATTTADISQRVISLSGSRTYNGSSDLDASIFTLSNLVGNETLTLAGTGVMADKNAGSNKSVALASLLLGDSIHGDGGLASNYMLVGGLDTVNIAKATISSIGGIAAGNKTYDGSANATLNTDGVMFNGKVAGDTLTLGSGAIGAFADQNAGSGKTVSITGLSLSGADAGNYTLADATATTLADIGQRIISLSGSRTYDGSADLDASIFTLSNLVSGDTLTLTGTGLMADKNAGAGKAVALGSLGLGNGSGGGLASNYTLIGGTDTVDIAKAMISSIGGITAGNKTYDGTTDATLDALGVVFNGKVLGDSLTLGNGVSGLFADANAGTGKVVSISGLSLSGTDAGNYTLADATATTHADIARRVIIVTANAASRAYGDANPALSYAIGGAGLVTGDSLSGSLATTATTASNVGSYGITQGSLDNANYTISYTGAGLEVTPRAITVSANAANRAYGDANPLLSYTIGGGGLVNNDMLSGDLVTSATGISNVGAYAITQGTLAASANYALTFTGGDLTVSKRAITVAASNASRMYGDANPALSYTIGGAGLVNNDSLSGTLATSATANSHVGSYGIGQGSLAASGNYDLTFLGGTLAVTPRAITVAANGAIRTYGDANPVFTYVAGGLVNGDSLSGSLASPATAASDVGTYVIGLGSLGNVNYAISYTGAGLTITPRLISVIAANASRVTGAANPVFTYTIGGAGLVNGDRLTGALASAADRRSNPGSYAIGQGTLAASANYDVSFLGGLLTVTAAPSSPTTDLASSIVPRSYGPGTVPLPPAPGSDKDTFSFTDDGTHDFLTDPRFAGSVVCFGDGMSCVVQPALP